MGRIEDFPANTCRVVSLPNGQPVMVINLDGEFHVLEGLCGQGRRSAECATVIEREDKVLCPWHGWELDLERGVCSANPDCTLKIFPVRLDKGDVLVSCK